MYVNNMYQQIQIFYTNKTMPERSQKIQTWGQVTSKVENSNNQKQVKAINKLRKITYRETLKEQMQEKQKKQKFNVLKKDWERDQIGGLARKQREKEMDKKFSKIKTQQWYQIENKQLMNMRDYSKNNEKMQEKTRNDVLINQIIDRNQKRKLETKKIFKLQENLNKKQIQIQNSRKNRDLNDKIYDGELYNAYVERQFEKKKIQRELWKNKYLRKGRYSGSDYDDKMAYSSYLDQQVVQKGLRKSAEKERIQQKIQPFNRNIDKPDSSPAYLGKITQSFDRRLQLSILDRHMKFKPNDVLARQSQTERSIDLNSNKSNDIFNGLPNYRKRQCSQPQIPQAPKLTHKIDHSSSTSDIKQKKQFKSYDFITGTQKTFFI